MSVEETNRVRAMLGLKPLNVGGNASGKPTEEEVRREDVCFCDDSRRWRVLVVLRCPWLRGWN